MTFDWARSRVVRLRASEAGWDQYGEPIPAEPAREELPACLFAPTSSVLPVAAGVAATVTEPGAYWPREWPDVRVGDELEIDGDVWRVNGRPQSWPQGLMVALIGVETTRGAQP